MLTYFILWSHFRTWPPGKICRIDCRVYRAAFTTASNPRHHPGQRWSSRVQQTEVGSDILRLLRRSRDFHNKLSWHLCHRFFPQEIFVFLFLRLSRLRSGESCGGSPAVFFEFSWTSRDKVHCMSESSFKSHSYTRNTSAYSAETHTSLCALSTEGLDLCSCDRCCTDCNYAVLHKVTGRYEGFVT